jgi:hypothetical protein
VKKDRGYEDGRRVDQEAIRAKSVSVHSLSSSMRTLVLIPALTSTPSPRLIMRRFTISSTFVPIAPFDLTIRMALFRSQPRIALTTADASSASNEKVGSRSPDF